jgi:hypothetical protein
MKRIKGCRRNVNYQALTSIGQDALLGSRYPVSVGSGVRALELDPSGMQGSLGSIVQGGRHAVRHNLLLPIG